MGVFSNDDIVFVNVDSDNVTFFSDDMDHNTTDFNNISLDDDNFDGNDPETNSSYQTYGFILHL